MCSSESGNRASSLLHFGIQWMEMHGMDQDIIQLVVIGQVQMLPTHNMALQLLQIATGMFLVPLLSSYHSSPWASQYVLLTGFTTKKIPSPLHGWMWILFNYITLHFSDTTQFTCARVFFLSLWNQPLLYLKSVNLFRKKECTHQQ